MIKKKLLSSAAIRQKLEDKNKPAKFIFVEGMWALPSDLPTNKTVVAVDQSLSEYFFATMVWRWENGKWSDAACRWVDCS